MRGRTRLGAGAGAVIDRGALLRGVLVAALALATVVTGPPPSAAAAWRTSGVFADDDWSVHEGAIEALAVAGITRGCGTGVFCTGQPVTRGEMAAFIVRAVPQPSPSRDWFVDDDGSRFELDIDRLREGGHTSGCNPPANTRFCPRAPVTRGQLAVFLSSALRLAPSSRDRFTDDDGSHFEPAIQSLAAAGITRGCNPPANTRFCPDRHVTRAQVASFLTRALDLDQLWPTGGQRCDPAVHACTAADRTHPRALRWAGLTVRSPSSAVELVGLHESNHDGARDLDDLGGLPTVVMASRDRGTGRRSAADIVVHPDVEVRAPVTGTVLRSGTYTLYCRYSDDFLVVEPDGSPGIEVKMLHIDGVRPRPGDRVVAGVTIVADRATPLPFASQVDELSAPRDWPHVHLEVVDTSIPDRPSGGC